MDGMLTEKRIYESQNSWVLNTNYFITVYRSFPVKPRNIFKGNQCKMYRGCVLKREGDSGFRKRWLFGASRSQILPSVSRMNILWCTQGTWKQNAEAKLEVSFFYFNPPFPILSPHLFPPSLRHCPALKSFLYQSFLDSQDKDHVAYCLPTFMKLSAWEQGIFKSRPLIA